MLCEKILFPFGAPVLLAFSAWFMIGWNFIFPTKIEQTIWRVFAVYHAVFGVYGGVYYLVEVLKWHRVRRGASDLSTSHGEGDDDGSGVVTVQVTETASPDKGLGASSHASSKVCRCLLRMSYEVIRKLMAGWTIGETYPSIKTPR